MNPSPPEIQDFILHTFNENEFDQLCFAYLGDVKSSLSSDWPFAKQVRELILYCQRNGAMDNLLVALQKERPQLYAERFAPIAVAPVASPSVVVRGPRQVFISHAHDDEEFAQRLANDLRQHGWLPWIIPGSINPGEKRWPAIQRGLNESAVFLVVITQSAIASKWVNTEVESAIELVYQKKMRLILLLTESCDVPILWSRYQRISFIDDYSQGRTQLEAALDNDQETADTSPTGQGPTPELLVLESPFRLELVRVPASEFLMGSDPSKDSKVQADEQPQHRVYVSEFHIGKYDIINAQFAAFVQATGYKTTAEKEGSGAVWSGYKLIRIDGADWQHPQGPRSNIAKKQNHPVVQVSWDDAKAFCDWLSQETGRPFRLPTEAEWEKAARGTDGRLRPWGDGWDYTRLNIFDSENDYTTTPVIKYSPVGDSPYGAADMAGNVCQWTADWYSDNEYKNQASSGSPVKDPTGPSTGTTRVVRGGSWTDTGDATRSTFRRFGHPTGYGDSYGFRIVISPISPTSAPSQPTAATPDETLNPVGSSQTPRVAVLPDRLVLESPFRLELVRVPAGEFLMGSDPAKDKDALSDEQPQHRVYVSEFYIGKYNVTKAQFGAFVKATGYKTTAEKTGGGWVWGWPIYGGGERWRSDSGADWQQPRGTEQGIAMSILKASKQNHPVAQVSWDDAKAFCAWLAQTSGKLVRLPTEAEWEKAARGTDGRIYPWGNYWDASKLNSSEGGVGNLTPVGKYSPAGDSPYGAADMAGNVAEWVEGWHNGVEYKEHAKSNSPVVDPLGAVNGDQRLLRGGSFLQSRSGIRCARRSASDTDMYPNCMEGFRVVVSPISATSTLPISVVHGAEAKASTPPNLLVIESPFHLELLRVPAGEFMMGSDSEKDRHAKADEQPQHPVYVSEFCVGRYLVTNAQYLVFSKARQIAFAAPFGKDNHPVVQVSWDDAKAFCDWLSQETGRPFRLPTEAEWEKAARGTDERVYPWGNGFDVAKTNVAKAKGLLDGRKKASSSDTMPVGWYSPGGDSPYGIVDMVGNVYQWTADWYSTNEYKNQASSGSPVKDPTGPIGGNYRVLRGGPVFVNRSNPRSAQRLKGFGDRSFFGFRVVVSLIHPTPAP